MRITLLGAGAWGTALSIAFAGKHELTLWSREEDVALDLKNTRENHRFFPGYKLPESVAVSTDLSSISVHALVDPGQLESALLNFALNARDAMPDGGRLHIAARPVELTTDAAALRNRP